MKTPIDPEIRLRILTIHPTLASRWGRMNAHQMICHLDDSFKVGLGEREASPATGVFQRTLMKWAALYLPAQWPKGTRTRPEVEQGAGGTPPKHFESDRAELLRSIERFCEPGRSFASIAHPFFGPLTQGHWMRWGFLHADHHLRQFGR